jgi:CheY-like chemotaxis protein
MPGMILLDMRMPVMNGWEFAREFRTRYENPCPIVVVTAAENARARAEEIGADGWLAKPFDLQDVLDTVARHLARRDVSEPPASPV